MLRLALTLPVAALAAHNARVLAQLTPETVLVAAAALGALVMPYNVFFQSALVNARPRDTGTDAKKRTLLNYLRIENFVVRGEGGGGASAAAVMEA